MRTPISCVRSAARNDTSVSSSDVGPRGRRLRLRRHRPRQRDAGVRVAPPHLRAVRRGAHGRGVVRRSRPLERASRGAALLRPVRAVAARAGPRHLRRGAPSDLRRADSRGADARRPRAAPGARGGRHPDGDCLHLPGPLGAALGGAHRHRLPVPRDRVGRRGGAAEARAGCLSRSRAAARRRSGARRGDRGFEPGRRRGERRRHARRRDPASADAPARPQRGRPVRRARGGADLRPPAGSHGTRRKIPMKTMADDHAGTAAAPGPTPGEGGASLDFIRAIVAEDAATGRHHGRVATRFPPEPNGYLHIGHAKSICLNFGVAEEHAGTCNLRFDDTNPTKEDVEYVDAIKEDVAWLGFRWSAELYASDYFERLYQSAVDLIKRGKAYVDSLNPDEMRTYRGTLTEPGRNSPYRDRPVAENLDLFARMRAGEFPDGAHVLRAKIDMASPNVNMRDPTLYRIRHASHHRTGDAWCIYPMYDFAHPLSDALERITHSLCTLEYEDHRPLYDWLVNALIDGDKPQQIEFARLNLNYTVMSKRKLLQLVQQGQVTGWDDPRMPTISGLRRRGYTPEAIRDFCTRIGVAKKENVIDVAQLEHSVREDLNLRAPRVMAVLRPLKVVITNYPADQVEYVDVINNPEDASAGTRKVSFSRELYIERDDFMENPPKKFFRLSPGKEVRLRCAYFITCTDVVKDAAGHIVELRCTYDPSTRGGDSPDGRRVKATLHWVSAAHAIPGEVRLYDRLFSVEDPENVPNGRTFIDNLNPHSLEVLRDCRLEPSLASAQPGLRVQFERLGYFAVDDDSRPGALVFNRTVSLRDTWAKIAHKETPR